MKMPIYTEVSKRTNVSKLLAIGACCAFLAGGSSASAQVFAPGNAATTEGNASSFFPFDIGAFGGTSQRFQQLYTAPLFAALPAGGARITDVTFRVDGSNGAAFSATLPSIRIDLSTTSVADDALSSTFASNVGANNTTVYGAATGSALSISSSATTTANGTKSFDINIHFTTPYLYNPSLGNLLMDVRYFDSGGVATSVFDASSTTGDGISTVASAFNGSVNDATGTGQTNGLVTEFTTAAVPEPATWLGGALVLTAGGLGISRRQKRQA